MLRNDRSDSTLQVRAIFCRTASVLGFIRGSDVLASNCEAMSTVINSNSLPWEERFNEKIGRALYRKNLFTDTETGMEIRLVRYPAGIINPRHTHPCAHGMYVLEGTLVTHEGRYGEGSFVWFPEGETMQHGASAEEDVIVLAKSSTALM